MLGPDAAETGHQKQVCKGRRLENQPGLMSEPCEASICS